MFGPRIQHEIYWLNPASAQDKSFYHNQKKKKKELMGYMEQSSLKKP